MGNMLYNLYTLYVQSFIVGRVGKPKGKMFTSCVIFIKYSFASCEACGTFVLERYNETMGSYSCCDVPTWGSYWFGCINYW